MKLLRLSLTLAAAAVPLFASAQSDSLSDTNMNTAADLSNPLIQEWDTPHGIPPFALIKDDHFREAMEAGFELQRAEVKAIIENPGDPTFSNTIEALELSGALIERTFRIFGNLTGTDTNSNLDALELEMSPRNSQRKDEIYLNEDLFQRVSAVYEARDELDLDQEQHRLLELTYRDFVRAGAAVPVESRARLTELNAQLAVLSARFGQNLREETKVFEMVIVDGADLSGLPSDVIAAARETARKRGHNDAWVFGLDRSSFEAFMAHAESRQLRRQLFDAYRSRAAHENDTDNQKILLEMARLRAERARLLGFETHADYQLATRMAKSPDSAEKFLLQVWKPGLARAQEELRDMRALAVRDGIDELSPWDWWYYAERVREQKFTLDTDQLKPFFELSQVRDGAFYAANRLFGVSFQRLEDVPVWNPDVQAFEVRGPEDELIGIFMADYYARDSKSGGAWMNTYRNASDVGREIRPIVTNNLNLIKPPEGQPTLLSFDEVRTLFHEFGHGLQGLLTTVRYERFSGTSGLPRDYVELCSQVMEHWAQEPEMLQVYARDYRSGEVIPDDLIANIGAAATFNQGFMTTEYVAASLLDLAWHTMTVEEAENVDDARAFEVEVLNGYGLLPEIEPRYRSPYFSHIFAGGYSAGYYAYLWAEILDADAFTAFKDSGDIFNPELAGRFKTYIMEAGGREEPEILYRKFRGKDPDIQPLLKIRGLADKVDTG
jgi:peptidyl-dipeptidase Dcp